MRILFLSPQPFYEERGTPIAVRLALEVLAKRAQNKVDLLTYHIGTDVKIPNVRMHRIKNVPGITHVNAGISLAKLVCDIFFLFHTIALILRSRREGEPYQLIHAVEESVFIAWLAKQLFGIPYIYDMDSSLALQLTEKWYLLRPLCALFELLEKIAVRGSTAVVPVCDALAVIANRHGSSDTHILRDISLLDLQQEDGNQPHAGVLKEELSLKPEDELLVYIGNLEGYQGIDLMVEAFAQITDSQPQAHLIVIGGSDEHVEFYRAKVRELGIDQQAHIVGPRPLGALSSYLEQADILLSPRTLGNNTPMKIYSYLHSGTAIVATALPTHTQVLNDEVAFLAADRVEEFSQALATALSNRPERDRRAKNARTLAEEQYTFEIFSRRLNELYDRVGTRLEEVSMAERAS